MDQLSPKDCFLQSLGRCATHEGFIRTFYQRLIDSSDEIRQKFAQTDFDRQNELLLKSLNTIAGCIDGDQIAIHELARQATLHNRVHLNIKPQLYIFWQRSLVSTASEFDEQWNQEIELAWKQVLSYVINHMKSQY